MWKCKECDSKIDGIIRKSGNDFIGYCPNCKAYINCYDKKEFVIDPNEQGI